MPSKQQPACFTFLRSHVGVVFVQARQENTCYALLPNPKNQSDRFDLVPACEARLRWFDNLAQPSGCERHAIMTGEQCPLT